MEKYLLKNSEWPRDYYLLALAYAAIDQHELSAKLITTAIEKGWMNVKQLENTILLKQSLPFIKSIDLLPK